MAKKEHTIALLNDNFDQIDEVVRRGKVRRYFQGKRPLSQRESVGVMLGGLFCLFFGIFVFPVLVKNPIAEKVSVIILIGSGIVLLIKGFFDLRKENATPEKPVPDEDIDACLENDLMGAALKSKMVLLAEIPTLREGQENLDEMENILLMGAEEYSANTNLPLGLRRGADGVLRASNYSLMHLYFGKDRLYIYTSVYNMRDGKVSFEHTYDCPYDMIESVSSRDVQDTVVSKNKEMIKRCKRFSIRAKGGNQEELSIDFLDYDMIGQYQGIFPPSFEAAVETALERIKGVI